MSAIENSIAKDLEKTETGAPRLMLKESESLQFMVQWCATLAAGKPNLANLAKRSTLRIRVSWCNDSLSDHLFIFFDAQAARQSSAVACRYVCRFMFRCRSFAISPGKFCSQMDRGIQNVQSRQILSTTQQHIPVPPPRSRPALCMAMHGNACWSDTNPIIFKTIH